MKDEHPASPVRAEPRPDESQTDVVSLCLPIPVRGYISVRLQSHRVDKTKRTSSGTKDILDLSSEPLSPSTVEGAGEASREGENVHRVPRATTSANMDNGQSLALGCAYARSVNIGEPVLRQEKTTTYL